MNPFEKEILKHPIIVSSIVVVVVITIVSVVFYVSASKAPNVSSLKNMNDSSSVVTASGTIEPAQNPNLAFVSGGRVKSVNVSVGQKVYEGQLLASLDIGILSAQRAQAQAKLNELLAGARQEDIDTKQTGIDQANITLTNLYTTITTNIVSAYDKSFSGLAQNTDNLFNQPNTANPTLLFSLSNSQAAVAVVNSRVSAQSELATWQSETTSLSSSNTDQVEHELVASVSHLKALRLYADQLLIALNASVPSGTFSQSALASAQVAVSSYRDNVNTLVSTLEGLGQQLSLAKLSVTQATNSYNQTVAGATAEQIEGAKALVASVDAQIANNVIVAPFSGTVASVQVKVGDIISPNTIGVSLNSESALQVSVYFSEIDITKIHVGQKAMVTLDAYGSDTVFDAHVVSVDAAPTMTKGVKSYKTTLQFAKSDSKIVSGMTANITIPLTK